MNVLPVVQIGLGYGATGMINSPASTSTPVHASCDASRALVYSTHLCTGCGYALRLPQLSSDARYRHVEVVDSQPQMLVYVRCGEATSLLVY